MSRFSNLHDDLSADRIRIKAREARARDMNRRVAAVELALGDTRNRTELTRCRDIAACLAVAARLTAEDCGLPESDEIVREMAEEAMTAMSLVVTEHFLGPMAH